MELAHAGGSVSALWRVVSRALSALRSVGKKGGRIQYAANKRSDWEAWQSTAPELAGLDVHSQLLWLSPAYLIHGSSLLRGTVFPSTYISIAVS